ncbi:hypothetical protein [Arsenicibacter rosenii]|uniref:Glycosyltransferase RgtA/B/C/D-like domain-containing protein n=1 Tax=Arsenicibacter rosenii TaxID=1750698 RepID=A0A1S2VME7_9BACT|nr:hypothetical protein [Arsenicibacter rosenii]OIN59942.1 hypothetical protein BLX24_08875 [Arsenicibacter rosenii]
MLKYFCLILCISSILIYYIWVIINSQNIPFADDLSFMANLYDIQTASSFTDKINIFFAFHNEHKLLYPRLLVWILARLQGGIIDIRWWIWIGNSFLLGVLYIFYISFKSYQKPFIYFVPVVLFFFQPIYIELTYWGMASIQNIGILLVSSLVLYKISTYDTDIKKIFILFLLTVSAVFTSANGLVLVPIIAGILLLKKRYNLLSIWIILGCILFWFYWHDFNPQIHSVAIKRTISGVVLSFFALLGSFLESQRYGKFTIVAGVFIAIAMAYLLWPILKIILKSEFKKISNSQLFLLSYFIFLLLTITVIAFNRNFEDALHVSRYKIYSVLILIVMYFLIIRRYQVSIHIIYVLIIGCTGFAVYNYKRANAVTHAHSQLLNQQLNKWFYLQQLDAPTPLQGQYYATRWTALYLQGAYIPPIESRNPSKHGNRIAKPK